MDGLPADGTTIGRLTAGLEGRLAGDGATAVTGLAYDSRRIRPGALFACLPGTNDGHSFAEEALTRGAAALLVERDLPLPAPQFVCPDTRRALGLVAAAFYDRPADRLRVMAVTGTNGKTTIGHLFGSVALAAGQPAVVAGTLGVWMDGECRRPPRLTTPESLEVQEILAEAVAAGQRWASLEASSHGLEQKRLSGTPVDIAVLSQITRDHLDFHADFEHYRAAKRRLFTECGRGGGGQPGIGAVLNLDDPSFGLFTAGLTAPVVAYSLERAADVWASDVEAECNCSHFLLHLGPETRPVTLALPGRLNVANALAAASAGLLAGFPPSAIAAGLAAITHLPGRMEPVDEGQPFQVRVDFAHNPAALASLLEGCAITPGKRIIVFGAEGRKDPGKRPLMGAAVAAGAEYAIITSDNTYDEAPEKIAREVEAGFIATPGHPPHEIILDRREAIHRAIRLAGPGDLVIIAGKGHESTLIGADGAEPFADVAVAKDALHAAGWRRGEPASLT